MTRKTRIALIALTTTTLIGACLMLTTHVFHTGNKVARAGARKLSEFDGIRMLAEKGDPYQQGLLSEIYRRGDMDAGRNFAEALKWARASAEKNHPLGFYGLAALYDSGAGVEKNPALAEENYRKSLEGMRDLAGKGDRTALYNLGYMLHMGKGVEKNQEKAFQNLMDAAEKGHLQAMFLYGKMLIQGEGVKKNPSKGVIWLTRGAARGEIMCEYMLGLVYLGGRDSIRKNPQEAHFWLTRAAKKGDADAQYLVGLMLEQGEGVGQDKAKAMEWFRKAAEKNHAKALEKLPRHMLPVSDAASAAAPPAPAVVEEDEPVQDKTSS